MPTPPPDAEFVRVFRTDELGATPEKIAFTATTGECAALAWRCDLTSLADLSVAGTLRRLEDGETVALEVHFTAEIGQLCVVTLDPIAWRLDERFERVYQPMPDPSAGGVREVVVAIDEADPPEPLIDQAIDVGAAVAEHLALVIDLYPRKENAAIAPQYADAGGDQPDLRDHPLAALRVLTKKADSGRDLI